LSYCQYRKQPNNALPPFSFNTSQEHNQIKLSSLPILS
jgi:hypothetical protein